MNTTARHLTPLTLIVATLAAAFMVQGARAEMPVVQLEPVHVTAQRVPAARATVVQLPAVEVTARRATPATNVVRLPAVEVTARRSSEVDDLLAQQRTNATPARKPV